MDNRFLKINDIIDSQSGSFYLYLRDFILNKSLWNELIRISSETDVYVFSGIIRNFLLGYVEHKDLDLVFKDIHSVRLSDSLFSSLKVYRNSFGGYKIKYRHLVIDAWDIADTWGIVRKGVSTTPQELVRTAFFNFSSIAYDLKRHKFIYSSDFSKFLVTHEIDVVYPENPNVALCIVNSMYYCRKYLLKISKNLCTWVVLHERLVSMDEYNKVQTKHFGKVLFTIQEINGFIQFCKKKLDEDK